MIADENFLHYKWNNGQSAYSGFTEVFCFHHEQTIFIFRFVLQRGKF